MIRKYTIKRINDDMYSTDEYELINGRTWGKVSSFTYFTPFTPCRADYPQQALKNHPWKSIRKTGDFYSFYACVYYFPDPRLAGKWKNYKTAYGWEQVTK